MTEKDNKLDDITHFSGTTDSPQTGSYRLSSEQAGQTLRWLADDICQRKTTCFPVYRIRKVKRSDRIIFDRHYLKYLNLIERLHCYYCSYVNGLFSYAMEIGARTEQYWCPIKHAYGKAQRHSRAHQFTDYGDAEAYRTKLEELRGKLRNIESD